jgi:hypothetical protein
MELKLEKKCSANDLEVGKRYAIGQCGRYPFIVSSVNHDRGFVLLKYLDGTHDGLVYLNTPCYYYEFPLSSLEKELL